MTDGTFEHGTVDPGNIDVILAAVEVGWRKCTFTIPHELQPSRRDIEALPVIRRRALIEPRLALRRDIERAKTGYRTRTDLNRTPWSAVVARGKEINRKVQSFSRLFAKDAAGKTWVRSFPDVVMLLGGIEARIAKLLDGQMFIDEAEESALDWLVRRLADVFSTHFGKKPKRAYVPGPGGGEYYSPFIAFVLEVAKEENISIKPSTIHRIMTVGSDMGRRMGKK